MDDNIIEIDDFYFKILNKINYNERQIVNIYSSKTKQELIKLDSEINFNEVNKFSVYLSNSDLGCFRLCLYYMGSGKYHKGDQDYIQQTFIHVKLQKFIHERLDKLDLDNVKCYCMVNPNSEYNYEDNETYYLNHKEWNKINNHIDLISRKIRKEPFKEYSKNKCGQDQDKKFTDVKTNLKNFSEKLKSLYDFSNDFSNNKPISKVNINDSDNVYDLEFYKVKLKLKDQEQEQEQEDNIILYYCNAKITKFMNKIVKPNPIYISLPVFLTTEENDKITEFGTFNKYILAGNYICKVFDYFKQCSEDDPNREKENYCFNEYVLIGDRYNNIFPLLEIREKLSQQTTDRELQTTDKEELEREEKYNVELLKEFLAKEEKEKREERDRREKLLINDQKVAKELQEQDRKLQEQDRKLQIENDEHLARQLARELAGGVIQMINDRCDTNIKNIRDSNCNQKIQKIQNIYNVRTQLIEDTKQFFNKKINKKLNLTIY
jgi:hypothetical protein